MIFDSPSTPFATFKYRLIALLVVTQYRSSYAFTTSSTFISDLNTCPCPHPHPTTAGNTFNNASPRTSLSLLKFQNINSGDTASPQLSLPNSSNPYVILNIDRRASQEEIKKAYRVAALRYHPDAVVNCSSTAEERQRANDNFARINAAYALLTKSRTRSRQVRTPTTTGGTPTRKATRRESQYSAAHTAPKYTATATATATSSERGKRPRQPRPESNARTKYTGGGASVASRVTLNHNNYSREAYGFKPDNTPTQQQSIKDPNNTHHNNVGRDDHHAYTTVQTRVPREGVVGVQRNSIHKNIHKHHQHANDNFMSSALKAAQASFHSTFSSAAKAAQASVGSRIDTSSITGADTQKVKKDPPRRNVNNGSKRTVLEEGSEFFKTKSPHTHVYPNTPKAAGTTPQHTQPIPRPRPTVRKSAQVRPSNIPGRRVMPRYAEISQPKQTEHEKLQERLQRGDFFDAKSFHEQWNSSSEKNNSETPPTVVNNDTIIGGAFNSYHSNSHNDFSNPDPDGNLSQRRDFGQSLGSPQMQQKHLTAKDKRKKGDFFDADRFHSRWNPHTQLSDA